jgi:hypothetical protein
MAQQGSACKRARGLPASALFLLEPGVKRSRSVPRVLIALVRLTPGSGRNRQRTALPFGLQKPASPGRVCQRSSAS